MLILSIVLAAMAPVMTTRSRSDNSSPWRFSPNLSDAYFGAGDKQVALIGQQAVSEDGSDSDSKLLLNSSANTPKHILFKRAGTILGYLFMKDSNIALGNTEMNIANITGTDNIAIGAQTLANVTTGSNNVAVGADALSSSTTSSWNVAIGKNAFHNGTDGSNTIIGGDAMSQGTGTNNVALGTNALYYGRGNGNVALGVNANHKTETLTTFTNSTAVGYAAYAGGDNSVALGYNSRTTQDDSISIGNLAEATESKSIAIGRKAHASGNSSIAIGGRDDLSEATLSSGTSSIAIGSGASTSTDYGTAIGNNAKANGNQTVSYGDNAQATSNMAIAIGGYASANSTGAIAIGGGTADYLATKATRNHAIAIGYYAESNGDKSIAIGYHTIADANNSIAIGNDANANGDDNIAIGKNACSGVYGSSKICIGNNSGPSSSSSWGKMTDSYERVFIGGRSKFNNADAVLEVHNTGKMVYAHDDKGYRAKDSTVVINGNLIVKGLLSSFIIDRYGHNVSGFRVLERYDEGEKNAGLKYDIANPGFGFDDYFTTGTGFSSDRRLKYVGKESNSGLDKIRQLKVYNYTFKKDKHKTPHVGVIAQDLQKIFPEAVKKAKNGFLTIRMEDMFYAMINAIKELDTRITALEKENQELKTIIKSQDARLKALEAKVK